MATNKPEASSMLFIRDLLEKKVIEENDLMIIEDGENTKRTTVKNFLTSMIQDDEPATRYRIYSAEKIMAMFDELETGMITELGLINNNILILDKKKANKIELESLRDALIAEIDKRANTEEVLGMIDSKRDKNIKLTKEDMDTSSDEKKLGIENLSEEVLSVIRGGTPIPSNRPPKGGWVTEDFADESITFRKLAEDYRYGGHFTEGDINEFVKDGIYTLGSKVLGLPSGCDDDERQIRLLTVETTETGIIKQKVEYVNDTTYRPIFRRVSTRNRLRITEFIRVEEINEKFKVHRGLLSDDFNNCGILENCDIFSVRKEGHYLATDTVRNVPKYGESYEIDIRKFGDRIVYQAIAIGNTKCDIYQAMQYYTSGTNPVNTQWYNTSNFARSKFEGKNVRLYGDGIIFGLGASDYSNKSIPSLLSNKYGMNILNRALGDATAGVYNDESLTERGLVTQIDSDVLADAEYAIIMVGTRDWDCGLAILGENNFSNNGSFKGSLNMAISHILEENASTKILLVSPIYRSRMNPGDSKNSDDYIMNDLYLSDFVLAMGEVAAYNHIPFVDLYNTSGINKYTSSVYLSDGLYLNDAGQELIATKILDAMNFYY